MPDTIIFISSITIMLLIVGGLIAVYIASHIIRNIRDMVKDRWHEKDRQELFSIINDLRGQLHNVSQNDTDFRIIKSEQFYSAKQLREWLSKENAKG